LFEQILGIKVLYSYKFSMILLLFFVLVAE
jgi:hypothetical protein